VGRKFIKVAENPERMDSPEFSNYIGINEKTAERWAREGRGPKRIKIGQRAYYFRPNVDAWIENLVRDSGRGEDVPTLASKIA